MDSKESADIFLLPSKYKLVGALLLLPGIGIAIVRFIFGIKPEFLTFKVISIYSSFIQKNNFTIITNHFSEEIAGLFILLGLFLISFSKTKFENNEIVQLRLISFYYSVLLNLIFILFGIIFIYGLGFIYFLILNMYSLLFIYIFIFNFKLMKFRKSKKTSSEVTPKS